MFDTPSSADGALVPQDDIGAGLPDTIAAQPARSARMAINCIGSTNATTTARDVFVQGSGVCRDFAHLSIAFCRALNIPARLVCGYCIFPEPPPDFHAIFEAYLGGHWVRFDPTGMAPVEHVVRVAAGRDAKDVAFATIYGPARMTSMSPEISRVSESAAPPITMGATSVNRQNGNMT